uniref:Uncharacterized protein n=1 Tax=Oryzias sinensis TaxID=183150 RepID=A0A8C7XDU7_9TELE
MTHLNEFYNIRMVQFFENGYLLINPLERAFGVSGAFNVSAPLLTWEPCLPHQLLLRQHFHRLQRKRGK